MHKDEAKHKWCPFGRENGVMTSGRGEEKLPSGPAYNRWRGRDRSGKGDFCMTKCLADVCMAWVETTPDHGYCGLTRQHTQPRMPDGSLDRVIMGEEDA